MIKTNKQHLLEENETLRRARDRLSDQVLELSNQLHAKTESLRYMRKLNSAWKNRSRAWELRCHLFHSISRHLSETP